MERDIFMIETLIVNDNGSLGLSTDNFVHRLIQNKTDGKLVEYGSGQEVRNNGENNGTLKATKEGIS